MNKNLLIGAGVLLAVIIIGFFLVPKKSSTIPNENQSTNVNTPVIGTPNPNLKEITITGTDFSFSPSTINLKRGDVVKITFKNEGRTLHSLTITDLNLKTGFVEPGKSDSIEFTADTAGTFSFICSVSGHKERGMEGTLVIE